MAAHAIVDSPLGPLLLTGSAEVLTGCWLDPDRPIRIERGRRDDAAFRAAAAQLDEYFAGERTAFDLALDPPGTPFQRTVWAELRTIPYGRTASYGELAGRIGRPTAARAVGLANGRNPISILIPCHRVVGSTGKLVGYGGGLERKRRLLALEAARRTPAMPL